MPEIILKTCVQLRNDTEENWKSVADTLIPLSGEACVTNDGEHKGQLKIGDGILTWGELSYIQSGEKNIIDCVKMNQQPLPVIDKSVNIPIATLQNLGVVKSSELPNQISVLANGAMELNSVNISKLSQSEDELLVLDSGDSKTKALK